MAREDDGTEALAEVGIVGGSGLYSLAGGGLEPKAIPTPFGEPSGPYMLGEVGGRRVAFLARHGEGHHLLPGEVNYRANVWGFKSLGCRRLVSASAVGSLREELLPRQFVVVDQFIDRTRGRRSTFFGEGLVAHVSLAEPTCPELRPLAVSAARAAGVTAHDGGTYLCMEGPQFSTRAESCLHRSWGASVVGMTNATEARLAREAELCYVSIAMVTDVDCWQEDEDHVSVEMLLENLRANAEGAARLLERLVAAIPAEASCPCPDALAAALITSPAAVPAATRERLALLVDRHLR